MEDGASNLRSIVGRAANVRVPNRFERQRLVEDEGDACPCVLLEADYEDESSQVSSELRFEGTEDG